MAGAPISGKNVRVVALGTLPGAKIVNIVTSLSGYGASSIPTWGQVTAAQAAAQPNAFQTVQAAGAAGVITPGYETVMITGYAGPN